MRMRWRYTPTGTRLSQSRGVSTFPTPSGSGLSRLLAGTVIASSTLRHPKPSPKASSIFLTLLRIYLQPGVSSTTKSSTSSTFSLPPPATLLQPALQLISRHSRQLDATETPKLLRPLVQARDVKEFLVESLRVPRFDTRAIGEIARARRDDVATRLMVLEERRVKVVDSRMWVTFLR